MCFGSPPSQNVVRVVPVTVGVAHRARRPAHGRRWRRTVRRCAGRSSANHRLLDKNNDLPTLETGRVDATVVHTTHALDDGDNIAQGSSTARPTVFLQCGAAREHIHGSFSRHRHWLGNPPIGTTQSHTHAHCVNVSLLVAQGLVISLVLPILGSVHEKELSLETVQTTHLLSKPTEATHVGAASEDDCCRH
jgi:hypothetical protein